MNIIFSPVDANYIKHQVESGYYSNATELVRDAVRRLREQENQRYDALMQAIAEGDADIAAGRYDEYTPALHAKIVEASLKPKKKRK